MFVVFECVDLADMLSLWCCNPVTNSVFFVFACGDMVPCFCGLESQSFPSKGLLWAVEQEVVMLLTKYNKYMNIFAASVCLNALNYVAV